MRTRIAFLVALTGLSLGACAHDIAYAQSGIGVAYDDPFYDPAACWNYGFSNFGWDGPYCGWYGGYFYPGSGIYVYGRDRRPHIWSDGQRQYWGQRREQWHSDSTIGARSALHVDRRMAARDALGANTVPETGISRPIVPHEMGMGVRGFGGRFGGFRGGPGRVTGGGLHGAIGSHHGH